MQAPELTPVPQRPNCFVWYVGDACDESIQQYHDMVAQRQQQEWDASVAKPLRSQIADQRKLIGDQQNQIKTLQLKIESQNMAALRRDARNRASLDLLGATLGVSLALLVAFAAFRKLAKFEYFAPPAEMGGSAGA
jgi:hypothetical protein